MNPLIGRRTLPLYKPLLIDDGSRIVRAQVSGPEPKGERVVGVGRIFPSVCGGYSFVELLEPRSDP